MRSDPVPAQAGVADVPGAARLHSEQLPGSFLACLGPGFLRVLYRRIVLDDSSTLQVVHSDDRLLGFVAGTDDTGRLMRLFVRRDAPHAVLAGAPGLLRHPVRAWETLRYEPRSDDLEGLPDAELLALAVDPAARRQGLGMRLIHGLQEYARARRLPGLRVTVAADNAAAIAAYERAGFRSAARLEVHRGRASEVLVWS